LATFNEVTLLLVLAVAIAIISQRLRIPYTIALVAFGVVVGVLARGIPVFGEVAAAGRGGLFSQQVFFGILLPPLVYEAALHIDFRSMRVNVWTILFLTFVGVIVSTILTGYLFATLAAVPLVFALLLGAILSPTDPIAVVDLFKRIHVPEELSTIIESESLLNDAIGIVVFVAISQLISLGRFDLADTFGEFALLVFGGTALGLAVAGVAYLVHRRLDDPNIETAVSVITAYGSFNLALALGFSGIICTAIAGIAIGTWVVPRAMSQPVKQTLFSFWSVVVYIVNSLIFLSMGLLVDFSMVLRNLTAILLVLGLVTFARAVFVYASYPISRVRGGGDRRRIPLSWYNTLTSAGVRGAIPVVLALTLSQSDLPIPADIKELVVSIVVGVALFSVTIQSVVSSWYIKKTFQEQAT